MRLAVDGYFVLRVFVRFIAGGIGFFVALLIIGSCVSIVGGGITALLTGGAHRSFATLPFTFGGRLAGLPFGTKVLPLVKPTICYLPLALTKAGKVAAVACVACLRIAFDHPNLKQRLGPLRDRGEASSVVPPAGRRRTLRRRFVRGLRRIDRLLECFCRCVDAFGHFTSCSSAQSCSR